MMISSVPSAAQFLLQLSSHCLEVSSVSFAAQFSLPRGLLIYFCSSVLTAWRFAQFLLQLSSHCLEICWVTSSSQFWPFFLLSAAQLAGVTLEPIDLQILEDICLLTVSSGLHTVAGVLRCVCPYDAADV